MAMLTGPGFLSPIDLYTSDTTNPGPYNIGEYRVGSNGKGFRYSLAGASALVKGNILQEAVEDTTYENMVIGTAGAVGDSFLQVTNGTATITSAQFEGGSIGVYTAGTVAVGDEYTIMGVTGTLTTGGALKVWLDRPLRYAYTTSATVNMKRSPWSGVIQAPITTQTGMAVGVAIYEIAASSYGWVQTHGICTVLSSNQTAAVGSDIGTPCLDAAGAASVFIAGTTHQRIGVIRQAKASGKGICMFLQID